MKKRLILTIISLVFSFIKVNAQAPIVRQNGSTIAFYNTIPAAVTAANNGDTIYIPGGSWNISGSLFINKTLHIFGTGHNPDSAQASGVTLLTGNIILLQGCSNGSLWGLYTTGDLVYNLPSDTIVNYSIRRCRFTQALLSNNFSLGLIAENVFNYTVSSQNGSASNNVFVNNIFGNCVYSWGQGNNFKNNLFLSPTPCGPGSITNCLFENNILLASGIMSTSVNSIFNNNLFVDNITFPSGTNIGSNNIVNQVQSSIMVNQSGATYNYSHNYHLQATCPGVNAGADGTNIGVYGGLFPWKDGSLPPNPHIQSKNISGTTDQNGNLQINIKVKAQNN